MEDKSKVDIWCALIDFIAAVVWYKFLDLPSNKNVGIAFALFGCMFLIVAYIHKDEY